MCNSDCAGTGIGTAIFSWLILHLFIAAVLVHVRHGDRKVWSTPAVHYDWLQRGEDARLSLQPPQGQRGYGHGYSDSKEISHFSIS